MRLSDFEKLGCVLESMCTGTHDWVPILIWLSTSTQDWVLVHISFGTHPSFSKLENSIGTQNWVPVRINFDTQCRKKKVKIKKGNATSTPIFGCRVYTPTHPPIQGWGSFPPITTSSDGWNSSHLRMSGVYDVHLFFSVHQVFFNKKIKNNLLILSVHVRDVWYTFQTWV